MRMDLIEDMLRPPVIQDMRRRQELHNQQARKNGTFGQVPAPGNGMLLVKTASEWMKQEHSKPMPRKLFGDFWFENELCILFADTNLGKSILAVQIGNNLAQGGICGNLENQLAPATPVLYVDFELGSKQFESRYVDRIYGSFNFSPTFHRAEFNPGADAGVWYDSFEEHLNAELSNAIFQTGAKVLIIDNLTYMRNGTQQAKDALPLMKQLKALKTKYQLSILALAHTPKRNAAKPITVNDLQGSKMLINFCDSAFAIGESHTVAGTRYLKQIKQRNAQKIYGEDNVYLCRIVREHIALEFAFDGFAPERDHLHQPEKAKARAAILQKALELKEQGLTYRDISQQLGIGLATVSRMLG